MTELIPIERIGNKILVIRGKKVLLDSDLAELYQVEISQLKRQVRRNIDRFSKYFMFELSKEEYDSLRCQFGILEKGRHSKYRHFVFTEQGIAMLSSVLRSSQAIFVHIQIMRAFIKMRKMLISNDKLAKKLEELEERIDQHDENTNVIMATLRKLINQPTEPEKSKLGFHKE